MHFNGTINKFKQGGNIMKNGVFKMDTFHNERVLNYLPGNDERINLKNELEIMKNSEIEIPVIVGGKGYRTGKLKKCIIPHDKNHILGYYHEATEELIELAIKTALEAKERWENVHSEHRIAIFKRASYLAGTTWKARLNAATMLCQSKTFFQAEIDASVELSDFFNINAYCLSQIYQKIPLQTIDSMNRIDYRPLEGFVYAVSPFNFTSIGGNLTGAPAIAGNTVVWKPASTSVYSSYVIYQLLEEAGMPPGIINFIPGNAGMISDIVLNHSELNAVNFTGSTKVFNNIWKTVGINVDKYRNYPRLVGETGGKNFVLAHNTAEIKHLSANLIRGAFEYQGQKCSATSRAYIPSSIWPKVKELLVSETKSIKIGDVEDFNTFMGAVIDKNAFDKIKSYIDYARASEDAEIICGGGCDDSIGYFIEPTIIETKNIRFKTMTEEIFGPVLSIYVYEDEDYNNILETVANISEYGLTGSIFAQDRYIIKQAEQKLVYAAGNFYINDKTTGAVVGQSPFGGSRASGTNDKVGTMGNMLRWLNPRSIKENYDRISSYDYNFEED